LGAWSPEQWEHRKEEEQGEPAAWSPEQAGHREDEVQGSPVVGGGGAPGGGALGRLGIGGEGAPGGGARDRWSPE
jgi:hypothetical protein